MKIFQIYICLLEEILIEDILPKIAEELDPFCCPIHEYLKHDILPEEPKTIASILFHARDMVLDNNMLYYLWYATSDKRLREFIKQVVVPSSLKNEIFKQAHCNKSDRTDFISKCEVYQRKKILLDILK